MPFHLGEVVVTPRKQERAPLHQVRWTYTTTEWQQCSSTFTRNSFYCTFREKTLHILSLWWSLERGEQLRCNRGTVSPSMAITPLDSYWWVDTDWSKMLSLSILSSASLSAYQDWECMEEKKNDCVSSRGGLQSLVVHWFVCQINQRMGHLKGRGL